ncbi:MAG: NAAT family transporter [Nitrospira sp.]|nr:NAAT family transporter [Nitrospira sp.]
MHDWGTYAHNATALFVIANPIGVTPLFISLTNRQTEEQRRHTARLTATTVIIVLITAMFLGEAILHLFGIRMASFRAGGGILILLMAIAMLQARPSPTHHTAEESKEAAVRDEVAVVPLGIPLVAGPGAISTVIIYADQATTWFDMTMLFLTVLCVAGSVWIALHLSDRIRVVLGTTGINIVTRLLGLILAAVGVEFLADGLAQLLPGLANQK